MAHVAIPLVVVLGGCDMIFELRDPPPVDDAVVVDAAPIDAPPPVTFAGLVARYSMDAVFQGAVRDETGNGHDAACVSCPVPRAGAIGGALAFERQTDVLTIVPDAAFETAGAFTVAAWIFLDSAVPMTTGANFGCIAVKRFMGNEASWAFGQREDGKLVFVSSRVDGGPPFGSGQVGDGPVALTTSPATIDLIGAWHHVAITWDVGTHLKRIVFDGGNLALEQENPVLFDMGLLSIGASFDGSIVDCHFPGAIDEVQIYSRALTDPEIGLLAERGA